MELIFQTDGETMKGPDWLLVQSIILVQPFRFSNSSIEEDLVETVHLVIFNNGI
jgi:hypothetical protein